MSAPHAISQDVPFAHWRLPGQAAGANGEHVPLPLQALSVIWSVVVLHDVAPHEVLLPGYTHAPVVIAQAVALQMGSDVLHAAVQQKPTPAIPHTPLAQLASMVQADPVASLHTDPMHVYPAWQSLPLLHEVRHAVPPPLQLYPFGQPDTIMLPEQVPEPLQWSNVVSVEPVHVDAEHVVAVS